MIPIKEVEIEILHATLIGAVFSRESSEMMVTRIATGLADRKSSLREPQGTCVHLKSEFADGEFRSWHLTPLHDRD